MFTCVTAITVLSVRASGRMHPNAGSHHEELGLGSGKTWRADGCWKEAPGKVWWVQHEQSGRNATSARSGKIVTEGEQTWGNQTKRFWKRSCESAKLGWRAGMGDGENWRSSTGTKAEKGEAKRPLVEALVCGLRGKSQWDPQCGRGQVAKEINKEAELG